MTLFKRSDLFDLPSRPALERKMEPFDVKSLDGRAKLRTRRPPASKSESMISTAMESAYGLLVT